MDIIASDFIKKLSPEPPQNRKEENHQCKRQDNTGNRASEKIERVSCPEHDQGPAEIEFHHRPEDKGQDKGGGFESKPPHEITQNSKENGHKDIRDAVIQAIGTEQHKHDDQRR